MKTVLRAERVSLLTLQSCVFSKCVIYPIWPLCKEISLGTVQSVGDYATGNNVPSLLFDSRKIRVACPLPASAATVAVSRANTGGVFDVSEPLNFLIEMA